MTNILLIGLVAAVLMVFLGIFLRLLTGTRMDLNDDVMGALSLLSTLVLVIIVSFLSGASQETFFDSYSEASEKVLEGIFPFLGHMLEGRDVLTLLREDTAEFLRELIHLLFMTIGLDLLKGLFPTTAKGKTMMGNIFISLTSHMILTVILAALYAYIKRINVVEDIVGAIMAVTTIALPIPAIVRVIINRNRGVFRAAGIIAAAFFLHSRTMISAGCYMVAVSLMANYMPQVLAGLNFGVTLLVAFAPCIIIIIGLGFIIRGVFRVR